MASVWTGLGLAADTPSGRVAVGLHANVFRSGRMDWVFSEKGSSGGK